MRSPRRRAKLHRTAMSTSAQRGHRDGRRRLFPPGHDVSAARRLRKRAHQLSAGSAARRSQRRSAQQSRPPVSRQGSFRRRDPGIFSGRSPSTRVMRAPGTISASSISINGSSRPPPRSFTRRWRSIQERRVDGEPVHGREGIGPARPGAGVAHARARQRIRATPRPTTISACSKTKPATARRRWRTIAPSSNTAPPCIPRW